MKRSGSCGHGFGARFLAPGMTAGLVGLAARPARAAVVFLPDRLDASWMTVIVLALSVLGLAALLWRVSAARARMRRSLDLAEALIESAPVGTVRWSEDGLATNARAAELLGCERIGGWEDIADAFRDPAPVRAAIAALRDEGQSFELTAEVRNGRMVELAGRRLEAADVLWIGEAPALGDDVPGAPAVLRAVLDVLPLPVWWRGPGFEIVDCNHAYAEAIESDRETVLRERTELGAGVIDEDGRGLARRALATGIAQSESHYVVLGGTRRLLEFNEIPVAGVAGGVVGYARDVTALEEVQSELAAHIAAHGEVLENLGTAIAIFGPDRRLKFFNTAFTQLWRVDPPLLRGEPVIGELLELLRERRVLPEYVDFPAFKQEQERLFVTVMAPQEELMHLPDGRTLRRIVSPHPFGGLLFVFEDVTDRLVLERSYNTLIEVQRETLNNLYEGVAVFGGDGRLRLWNPTLVAMWGLDDDFVSGHPHIGEVVERTRSLFPPIENWPARKEQLMVRVTEPEARVGRLERSDGIVLDFACVPLPDGGCLLSYIDVTDTVRVQRALEERNIALENADQVKTEFIASVSYELRTPLNAITGFSDILADQAFGTLNPRQREYIEGIRTASRQLTALIDDIIDLATIEAGYMALDLGEVSVQGMLEEIRDLSAERLKETRVAVGIDCPPTIGCVVADVKRLRQAMLNLIANVVMQLPASGTVTISAQRRGEAVEIAVLGSEGHAAVGGGEPVAPERSDPFVRRSATGIGLALTRSLIELHGGEVELRNEPGRSPQAICRIPVEGPVPEAVNRKRGAM